MKIKYTPEELRTLINGEKTVSGIAINAEDITSKILPCENVETDPQKLILNYIGDTGEKSENDEDNRLKEFEELAKPISEFIIKHYDPHTTVIITDGHAKVVRDDIGVPIEND